MAHLRIIVAGLLLVQFALPAAAQDADADKKMMRLLGQRGHLLYPEELRGNCPGLTVTLKTHIDRLRELQKTAKKEEAAPPSSLFGGTPAASDLANERDRVQALNVVLDAKGCQTVNVDEELQKTPPAPVGAAKEPMKVKSKPR